MPSKRANAGRRALVIACLIAVGAALYLGLPAQAENESAMEQPLPPIAALQYRVGVAVRDITPDLSSGEVTLHCYGDRDKKPAAGVLDPLHVRALAVADPAGRLVGQVSYDQCYVNRQVRHAVVKNV
ncbi:MAG: hypothetical protein ACTSXZ_10050 [Alphaproteobacteria bacterium]